ncbi:MAG: hypothetical protein V4502_07985 [Pseudomonadota bacterium]
MKLFARWRSIRENWEAYRKDHPVLTISQVLKSRTFWTLVLLAAFNGLSSITTQIHDPHLASAVNGVLSLAAIYFRIAPHQNVETNADVGKPR